MTVQKHTAGVGGMSVSGPTLYGHPRFYELTTQENDLHSRKNRDYAGGGHPLGNFRRVANLLSQYPGLDTSDPAVVALIYALKQLDAVLWLLNTKREGEVEGIPERLMDISVYAKLARIMVEEKKGGESVPIDTSEPETTSPRYFAELAKGLGAIENALKMGRAPGSR